MRIQNSLLAGFLLSLIFATLVSAQNVPEVEVRNVRFDSVGDNWMMVTIQLRPDENTMPDAISRDFIDNVKIDFFMGFEVDRSNRDESFDFYRSSARIISMQRRQSYNVHFFLPGVIRDRDNLRRDPFAWVVQIEVDGNQVPLRESQYSRNSLRSREAYDSLVSNANAAGAANDGKLVPVYLAPEYIVRESRINFRDVPAYYRFELDN